MGLHAPPGSLALPLFRVLVFVLNTKSSEPASERQSPLGLHALDEAPAHCHYGHYLPTPRPAPWQWR